MSDRRPPESSPSSPQPIGRNVFVRHEDDDVLVVEKPVGILSSLVGEQRDLAEPNVFDLVKEHRRRRRRGRGRVAWIVHRLDREVSGLMVFATSEQGFDWLKEDLRSRRVQRRYLALVEGRIERPQDVRTPATRTESGAVEGTIRSALVSGRDGRMRPTRADDEDAGQPAITHWQVVAVGRSCTLVAVRLETGRRNQIRVHMAEMGHPIVGDHRHGAESDLIRRVGLHAATLSFQHPRSGRTMRFDAPAPDSFWRAVGRTAPSDAGIPESFGREDGATIGRDDVHASTAARQSEGAASVAPSGGSAKVPGPAGSSGSSESWDHVATWYDDLIGTRGSDHHERVILPGTLHLLDPRAGMRVLDVACGQGILARRLAAQGIEVVGVDSAPRLVDAARREARGDARQRFMVGDARQLDVAALGGRASFDAAACVMALMNIDPLESLFATLATLLRPAGTFVSVLLHPAFRAPGQSSWGWSTDSGSSEAGEARDAGSRALQHDSGAERRRDARTDRGSSRERRDRDRRDPRSRDRPARNRHDADRGELHLYRRIDGYLSPTERSIVMNPGAVSSGAQPVTTTTHHRPLQTYVRLLASRGFLIDRLEEWPSVRTSQPGPRAAEENRARREIPMFLAIRAVARGG